jgi:hypothetical protein
MGEFFGTRIADPSGFACSALTTAIWLPPAAANTGGASPTLPTSTEPDPIAWSIGGPEVKSDQCALNGSMPISPAAVSSACAPDPAWSPRFRVTFETSVVLADLVPLAAGVVLAAEPEPDEEHADTPRTSRPSATTPAPARRPVRPPRCEPLRRVSATFLISFLPC